MPSPAAGKSEVPRTPTKLGRKPQVPPKLNKPQSQSEESPAPDVSEKVDETKKGAEDTKEDVKDKAEDTKTQAEDTADDTKEQADDAAEDTTGKVSQAGDELEQAEPKPVDDDDEETGADDAADETGADDDDDDATQKAGDEDADETNDDDNTEDDATDAATDAASKTASEGQQKSEGALSGARGLAGRASNLAGKASKDPQGAAKEAGDDVEDAAEDAAESAKDTADDATEDAEDAKDTADDVADDATEDLDDTTDDKAKAAKDTADDATKSAKDTADDATEDVDDTADDATSKAKDTADESTADAKDTADDAAESVKDKTDDAKDSTDDVKDSAEDTTGQDPSDGPDLSVLKGLEVNEEGMVNGEDGKPLGRLVEGDAEDLAGYPIGENGEILDDDGDLVGRCELLPEAAEEQLKKDDDDTDSPKLPDVSALKGLTADKSGQILNEDGDFIGTLVEGDPSKIQGMKFNEKGEIVDKDGNVIARAEIHPDATPVKQDDDDAEDADDKADDAEDAADDVADKAEQAKDGVKDTAEDVKDDVKDTAEDAKDDVKEAAADVEEELPGVEALQGMEINSEGDILNDDGDVVGHVADQEGDVKDLKGLTVNDKGEVVDSDGNVLGQVELAEGAADKLKEAASGALDTRILDGLKVNKKGKVLDAEGEEIGELKDGDVKDCAGKTINEKGEVLDKDGKVIGKVDVLPSEAAFDAIKELKERLGENEEPEEEEEEEKTDDADADADADEEETKEPEVKEVEVIPEIHTLDGLKVNKKGQVLNEDGEPIGELSEGEASECAGKKINEKGEVVDQDGKVLGKVKTIPQMVEQKVDQAEDAAGDAEDAAGDADDAADDAKDHAVDAEGNAVDAEGNAIDAKDAAEDAKDGAEGAEDEKAEAADKAEDAEDAKAEAADMVDDAEDVKDEVADKAEDAQDAEEGAADAEEGAENAQEGAENAEEGAENAEGEAEEMLEDGRPPLSILEGLKVNKSGKLIDAKGDIVGELVEGDAKKLSKGDVTCDAEGKFWDNKGKVIGRAETIAPEEGEEEAPFAGLEGLIVVKDGFVDDSNGNRVGQVVEGDAKKLVGRAVDEDGDILDKKGSVVGHAERYEEPEQEAEPEAEPQDLSILIGKTVNKAGYVIGDEGVPIGRLVEGNAKELTGRKIDEDGQIWNDSGKVIGRCELIPESEREAKLEGPFAGLEDLRVIADGKVADEDGNVVGQITEGNPKRLVGMAVDEDGDIMDKYGNVKGHAEPLEEEEVVEEAPVDLSVLNGLTLNKQGYLVNQEGVPIGRLVEGNASELVGRKSDDEGLLHNDTGKVIGRCELIPEAERTSRKEGPFAGYEGLRVVKDGFVDDAQGNRVGQITEGDHKKLVGHQVDEDGDIIDKYGNVKGHAEPLEEVDEVQADTSVLDGLALNKQGFLVNHEGVPIGRLVEGNLGELAGRKSDGEGLLHNDTGKVVGRCEVIPENERVSRKEGPFAGFEGLRVVKDGFVDDAQGNRVGQITEGDHKKLVGHQVDEDGDIIDKYGNVKGHAEPLEEIEEEEADTSILDGLTLNKQGFLVNHEGIPVGKLVEGNLSELAGRKADEQGQIHGDTGKVVGRCVVIPENERVSRKEGPFAGFEGLRVVKDGFVDDAQGNRVGQITEGDHKKLVGHQVDEDGDIIDKYGNVKGHAEPYSEEEEEEVEADLSALAGCTINKAGNVVDSSGAVLGRVAEGDPSTMIGKKVDGKGQIWDNEGNVIGRAELAPGAQSGPEGPFAGFDSNTVAKDGTVQTLDGSVIGRVIEGDVRKLVGHKVDEEGDINDKNGNVIGKAERWEPEEKERRINPMSGMRVNKEGEVRDANGDVLGRLTAGDLGHCAGLEIDDNGYVIDNDGNKVGEVTLLGNIAEEEEEIIPEDETEEERQAREDAKLAEKMNAICQQTLERVQPVMKQITEYMEQADRTPREELDEEELVNNVKPLIEEGGRILNECNGSLRGLDPDGRIAAQAKGRQQTGEASPEEYKLADSLKELTTTVVTTIDNAKKKLADMPHAKKKLNPLWSLLTEPLFQIIAAVGLLLTGVLNLVGKLLNGLGLGGLVNGLLGGLGINKLLNGLGLGSISDMLGGGKKKGEKKGGMSNIPLVGGLLGKK